MKNLLLLLVVLLIASVALAAKDRPLLKKGEPFYEYRESEVLMSLHAGFADCDVSALAAQVNGRIMRYSELLNFYTIELTPGGDVVEAVKYLRSLPEVKWVNFNYIAHACYTPNDPYFSYQWHYFNINMEQAWDITLGSSSVTVAVADQGWQFNHQDWVGVQTVSPYDFIEDDNDPSSTVDDSHGMHTAGTIIAATNNGVGVAGIAPQCRLMPIRVLDDAQGSGTIAQISDGIAWAGTHGADVLSLSLGFPVSGPPQDPGYPLNEAIAQTAGAGTVIFAATGNDAQPYVAYPAAYEECIAVGATALDDAIAPYSNQGTAIDITAPGGNTNEDLNEDEFVDGVLSTVHSDSMGDYYIFWQGTSMATPHAAGVAALLISNGLPPEQVRQALEETAVDFGSPGWDQTFGHGRINAAAALQWQGGGGEEIILLEEGFEGNFPPQNWQVLQLGPASDNWVLLAGNGEADCGDDPHSGANAVFHDDDEGVEGVDVKNMLIVAPVDIPADAEEVHFRFFQRNCYVPDWYEDSTAHWVMGSTNGTSFNLLVELDQRQSNWAEVDIEITGAQGQRVWFSFYYQGDYATEWYIDDVQVAILMPSASPDERDAPLPESITLLEPYPNPFNSTTTIPLELPSSARVELAIFNVLGQRVATLFPSANLSAGAHHFTWNAQDAATGLYIVTLQGDNVMQSRKILLVK